LISKAIVTWCKQHPDGYDDGDDYVKEMAMMTTEITTMPLHHPWRLTMTMMMMMMEDEPPPIVRIDRQSSIENEPRTLGIRQMRFARVCFTLFCMYILLL
ncbi:hypothetical protein ACR2WG_26775, partial [Klebsiella pneumoniae]